MDSMCRLCLVTANGEDIFDNGFQEVIIDSFGIELQYIPNWPSHACETCTNFLNELKDFKVKIERSQEHLQQLELKCVVKAEPLTDIYDELPQNDDFSDVYSSSLKLKAEGSTSFERNEEFLFEEPPPENRSKRKHGKRKPTSSDSIPFDDTSDNSQPMEMDQSMDRRPKTFVKCRYCNQMVDKASYRRHLNECHLDMEVRKCDLCGEELTSLDSYKKHMDVHNGVKDALQARRESTVMCEQCGKEVSIKGLRKHVKREHKVVKIYKCNICDKQWNRLTPYKIHMEVHMGIKHSCHFCDLQASSWTSRHEHMKRAHYEEYMEYRNNPLNKVRIRRPSRKVETVMEESEVVGEVSGNSGTNLSEIICP